MMPNVAITEIVPRFAPVRVPAGAHEVELRRNGFETRRTSVTVGSGSTVRITKIVLTRVAP